MGYRNITVDGVDHKYTVGRTHVKVRGMEATLKEHVGEVIDFDPGCECCGEPLSLLYPDDPLPTRLVVEPSHIADFIRKASA